jgi:hypothetical protein
MNAESVAELNLALAPDDALGQRHIALSKQMARQYPTVITLNGTAPRLAFAPHLTIYQVAVHAKDLDRMCEALSRTVTNVRTFALGATEYGSNLNEGSFEVRYEATPGLVRFQDEVVAIVNPLRGDLLREMDPAGRPLREFINASGVVADNIRRTGFDAVGDPAKGGTFGPHVTINWFRLGTPLKMNAADWPPLSDLSGRFVALGIFLLGPYGTCTQRLATLELQ